MSLDREQDADIAEDVDEDDMPPLVDNPNPSLTYTFFSEMTPSFTSTPAPTATQDISPQPSMSLLSSPPASPITPDEATPGFSMPMIQSRPHGKRRDPSYIPRPPNAFILFRSAFIREQNVPGKVEGNHSKLSKIIGLCWKQLSPEEREKWEAQAIVAQAEHRSRYPDWRFRPGANAMAKLKVNEGAAPTTRRRSVRSRVKDPPTEEVEDDDSIIVDVKGKPREKGKGKEKPSRMPSLEETRCAKIAGFVAEGIKGEELEVAVKQWEGDRRILRPAAKPKKSRVSKPQAASSTSSHSRSRSDASLPSLVPVPASKSPLDGSPTTSAPTHLQNSHSPILDIKPGASESNNNNISNSPATNLSTIPLTHMFKRSLSVPAPGKRAPYSHPSSEPSDESSVEDPSPTSAEPSPGTWGTFKPLVLPEAPIRTHSSTHVRRDTTSFPTPSAPSTVTYDAPHFTWQEAENQRRMEEMQSPDSWWSQRSPVVESQFAYDDQRPSEQDSGSSVTFTTDNMGYEAQHDGTQFDRGYMEQYRSFEPAQDGSQNIEWTDLSSSSGGSRQGLITVIEDPYKDDCNNNSPTAAVSPPTLSLSPPSNSSYYYSPISPTVPSSSFSTLTGWAGDYKQQQPSSVRAWPDSVSTPLPSATTPSPGWYNNQGPFNWGESRPQPQHTNLSVDSHDWDRHEYRASSDMHLQVEPRRQLNFQEELRRMHSSS